MFNLFNLLTSNVRSKRFFLTELPNGLTVSTVKTSDMGNETALFDTQQKYSVYIVERDFSDSEAESVHNKWIDFASKAFEDGGTAEVTALGYGDWVDDKKVMLKV